MKTIDVIIRTLVHCWWECKMGVATFRRVWQFLKKLNIDSILPYSQVMYSRKMKTSPHKVIHQCIELLFIITTKWKTTQVYQIMDKICYIHIKNYYAATKRTEGLIHAVIWMNLEDILNERNQTQKVHIVILFIQNVQNRQTREKSRDNLDRCLGLRLFGWDWLQTGTEDENLSKLDCSDGWIILL